MIIKNIDVINSLIPVCAKIDELGYGEECMCQECRSQSSVSEYSKAKLDFVFFMANHLIDAENLLGMLSPEYIARFEEYEIDFEDLMQSIDHALESPQQLCANLDIIREHIGELWELCEAEVEHYLMMTHFINHNDLLHIEIGFEGSECDGRRVVCRAAAESARG